MLMYSYNACQTSKASAGLKLAGVHVNNVNSVIYDCILQYLKIKRGAYNPYKKKNKFQNIF